MARLEKSGMKGTKAMQRSLKVALAVLIIAGAACTWLAVPAAAQKTFLAVARRQYNVDERSAKCTLCHEAKKGPSRKTLNVFGKSLQAEKIMEPLLNKNSSYVFTAEEQAVVAKALAQLEDQDADGDGATNKEEFALGSIPGDPDSKPDPKALEAYRKAAAAAKAKEPDKKKTEEKK